MAWFKKQKYVTRRRPAEEVPPGLWTKCDACQVMLPKGDLKDSLHVCPACGHHHRIGARARIGLLADPGTFVEWDVRMMAVDALGFVDSKPYKERLVEARTKTGERDAIVTGEGAIDGRRAAIGAMEFGFMGGSMGTVVGEKVARLFERATDEHLPAVTVTSSGGARMQEGIHSLMQMAKTAAAVAAHRAAGLLYISVLADPTTGGTTASFAMLGDIHLAEPGALIGFAGPRVIEQTIRQKLPPGFQRAEFVRDHGFVDAVVRRADLKPTISRILRFAGA